MTILDTDRWDGRLFSGGWRDASATLKVTEPATGEVLGQVGLASGDDVAQAVERAQTAQPEWSTAGYEQRRAVMNRAAQLIDEHHDELRDWIVRETGAVPGKGAFELHVATNELLEAGAMLSDPYGQMLPTGTPGRLSYIRRIPYGIVGSLSPWNFPLILSIRTIAPALAVGNAVIHKPSPETPISGGFLIARLLEEAGLPEGVLHVLPGDVETGQAIVQHPRVPMISFTGSTEVGNTIAEQAAPYTKRVALELGGNNALIVLDDADMEAASSAGSWSTFFHQGQICMTAGRHIIHERVADEYVERLVQRAENLPVGDPFREQVALGPLINQRQLDRVSAIVDEAVVGGADLASGGPGGGLFYKPTVLTGVSTDMRAYREEVFGPVAPVVTVSDDDEAVALANDSEYGLTAAIQTGSMDRGLQLAERLRCAMVHINESTVDDEAHVPFGGIGASGNGARFGGKANWEEFTFSQWVTVRDRAQPFPM